MATPYGAHVQLGLDRENTPLFHRRFVAAGTFAVCLRDAHNETIAGVLIDTGATIHVAGALWRTRLALLPGVGGRVPASLGRCTLELDFHESTSPPPAGIDSRLSSTHPPRPAHRR